jgi:hypothetical protein
MEAKGSARIDSYHRLTDCIKVLTNPKYANSSTSSRMVFLRRSMTLARLGKGDMAHRPSHYIDLHTSLQAAFNNDVSSIRVVGRKMGLDTFFTDGTSSQARHFVVA